MGEMTQVKSESLGKGLLYRVHIDSGHPLEKYGFLPGTNYTVNWNDENDFTVSSTTEPTLEVVWDTVALNVNLPPRLQDEGEIQYQLKWSQGHIIGLPVPNELPFHLSGSENNEIDDVEEAEEEEFEEEEFDEGEFMVQLRDVIEKTDNSRSSNSKYKIPPPGSDYSVRQLIAGFLEIDEDGVYIVGVTTRFHNLRKNLLQSTQNDHRLGVGIFLGEDWKGQTLRRYINDEKITHNFKDGVLFFCLFNGVLVFVGASLTSDIHEFKLRRLREEAVVQVHKSSNAPAGKLGELIKIMQGQTISSAKTEYHCSLVNEFVVIFDESEKTGRVMLPTDLVMEWIEAMENGAINTSMSPRKCRKIVSKNSKWAAHLHSLETHLKATVTHWHNSSHSSQLE